MKTFIELVVFHCNLSFIRLLRLVARRSKAQVGRVEIAVKVDSSEEGFVRINFVPPYSLERYLEGAPDALMSGEYGVSGASPWHSQLILTSEAEN